MTVKILPKPAWGGRPPPQAGVEGKKRNLDPEA